MMKDAISLHGLSREKYIYSLFFDKNTFFWPLENIMKMVK